MSSDQGSRGSVTVWKPVVGYEGLYEVSNAGEVCRLPGDISRTIGATTFDQHVPGKMLKPTPNVKSGYPAVMLCRDGDATRVAVHSIVATAFIGPRPQGHQVRHKDGNPANPHVDNLCYGTPVENGADRRLHGTDAVGSNNPAAVLNEEKVAHLKKRLQTETIKAVSESEGLNYSTVRSVNNGSNWSHIKPAE